MKEPEQIIVFVTTRDEREADTISQLLLKRHLIACSNTVKDIRSQFRWQSALESENECLLILKSRLPLLNDIIGTVKSAHSYEVPEVIAIPIIGGNQDYLNWINEETLNL